MNTRKIDNDKLIELLSFLIGKLPKYEDRYNAKEMLKQVPKKLAAPRQRRERIDLSRMK